MHISIALLKMGTTAETVTPGNELEVIEVSSNSSLCVDENGEYFRVWNKSLKKMEADEASGLVFLKPGQGWFVGDTAVWAVTEKVVIDDTAAIAAHKASLAPVAPTRRPVTQ